MSESGEVKDDTDHEYQFLSYEGSESGGYSSYSGWSTCGDEDNEVDLFDTDVDALEFLKGMEAQHQQKPGDAIQQYRMIRKRRRAAMKRLDEIGRSSDEDDEDKRALEPPPIEGDDDMEEGGGLNEKDTFERKYDKMGFNRCRRSRRLGLVRKGRPRGSLGKNMVKDEEYSKMLSEATFLFASRQHEEAQNLCMEIIGKSPNFPEPYHTVGMILEAEGDTKRALDFYMVAAHFTPRDTRLWKQLAGLSTEVGYLRQAIYCLSRVIKHDKNDIAPQWDRALLYAEVNEEVKAARAFEAIGIIRKGDPEVVKMLAKLYHRMGSVSKAIDLLEAFMSGYKHCTDLTHVNILAELYIRRGNYSSASLLISRAAKESLGSQDLPIDLQVKAGICAAHTGDMLESDKHLRKLVKENPANYADLFLDVGNNLLQLGYSDRACEFFEALLKMAGMPAVVQMYKEITQSLSYGDDNYAEACVLLIESVVETEQLEEAQEHLDSLRHLINEGKVHLPGSSEEASSLLLRMEELALTIGQGDSFLERMLPIVHASVKFMKRGYKDPLNMGVSDEVPDDLLQALTRHRRWQSALSDSGVEMDSVFKGHVNRRRLLKHHRAMSEGETDAEGGMEEGLILKGMLRKDDQYQVLIKVVDALIECGRESEGIQLLETILHVSAYINRACDKHLRDCARFKLISILMALGHFLAASNHVKLLISKYPYSIKIWNRYSQILGKLATVKGLTRFLDGVYGKHPSCIPARMMIGHVMIISGCYVRALREYLAINRLLPNNPLVLLLIGVTYISLSMATKVQNRHTTVLNGLAFLEEYGRQRGNKHEYLYNMGRAAHQLGLVHMAVKYYEDALVTDPPRNETSWKMEAAHNLVLIFKASGARGLARDVMMKYLTI